MRTAARQQGPKRRAGRLVAARDQARRLPYPRRLDAERVKLLTRAGLDWTERYELTTAIAKLKAHAAYLDGELRALGEHGITSFAAMQGATDLDKTRAAATKLVSKSSLHCTAASTPHS
jgi:hypothetical protein